MADRLQAGAIPFRTGPSGLQFLLVTSRGGNWIFPKGVVESDETAEAAALKEVQEEAGVTGTILPLPLGAYRDRKDWEPCHVLMFLLQVAGECARWREGGERARRWCSYEDALSLLKKGHLRDLLRSARDRLQGESKSFDTPRTPAEATSPPPQRG
jgi:hypothetical protein